MGAKIDFATSVDHVTDSLRQTETVDSLGRFLDTLYEAARPMVVQS
jgi:hypothetical protein